MGQYAQRRRDVVGRRPTGTGLEYGLIAAALAVAIVTVVASLGARYSAPAHGLPAASAPVGMTGAAAPAAAGSGLSRPAN
ncbi:hypothetical protein [Ancylobacter lacus]|uniref:hypothetical protein n=1 Tax=Ancylobacter lacus TaxID=2579970 RepID=UPI001BD07A71|nr:hypothetical protein [Ancylobacter lacus]MBS7538715.1 hypothetical protein [Ancylobacter lacus]